MSIFSSGKELDTVYFRNSSYRTGYVPNFDFWWGKKFSGDSLRRRGFYLSVNASSNFPRNKYTERNLNLYLMIRFLKNDDSKDLELSVDGFDEVYQLTEKTSTLLFHRKSEGLCSDCIIKIKWEKKLGIVEMETKAGGVWTIRQ